jgi:hypothetical protein
MTRYLKPIDLLRGAIHNQLAQNQMLTVLDLRPAPPGPHRPPNLASSS